MPIAYQCTLNISLPTSPSSLIWASSVSKVIHCSLYISASRWACFRSSCIAWWNGLKLRRNYKKLNKHSRYYVWKMFTLSSSLCVCCESGWGRVTSRALLLLGCHPRPWSLPVVVALLTRSWQESSSLSSLSFSTIQVFSCARDSNFSCKKSLVLCWSRFWVLWSLKWQMWQDRVIGWSGWREHRHFLTKTQNAGINKASFPTCIWLQPGPRSHVGKQLAAFVRDIINHMNEIPTCRSELWCGPDLSADVPVPPPFWSVDPPAETLPALWPNGFVPPSEPAAPPPGKVRHKMNAIKSWH